jgi:hypothetical protein
LKKCFINDAPLNKKYYFYKKYDEMRDNKKIQNFKALLSRKIKTYKPEEIKAAGGADKFGELIGQNPKRAFKNLMLIALTNEEYSSAIQILNESK